jgi:hypothetical protein
MIFTSFYSLLNSAQILLISLLSICTLLIFKNWFKGSGGKKIRLEMNPRKTKINSRSPIRFEITRLAGDL